MTTERSQKGDKKKFISREESHGIQKKIIEENRIILSFHNITRIATTTSEKLQKDCEKKFAKKKMPARGRNKKR